MMEEGRIITTADGLAKLEAELNQLKQEQRPAVLLRIKDAKELGDLSENADYSDAKEQQAFIEGRIMELEQLIKKAVVVKPQGSGIVEVGSQITVKGPQGEKTLHIVGSTEADPSNGFISYESPLGQAFLDHKVGDEVIVTTPRGNVSYTITNLV